MNVTAHKKEFRSDGEEEKKSPLQTKGGKKPLTWSKALKKAQHSHPGQ